MRWLETPGVRNPGLRESGGFESPTLQREQGSKSPGRETRPAEIPLPGIAGRYPLIAPFPRARRGSNAPG